MLQAQADQISDENLARVRALNQIALARGQSLAQLALAWVLRRDEIASAIVGASRPEQVHANASASAIRF